MFAYHFRHVFNSIKSTPLISLVTVVGIAIGIAVSTSMITIFHIFSQDPIPHKSDLLYNVRMDSWDPNGQFFGVRPGDPPKQVTYRDMAGVMDSDIPRLRTGVATALGYVFPDNEALKPYQGRIQLVHADFFAMTEAPFKYGGGWTREQDRARSPVIVIDHQTNDALFGGENSLGQTIRLGGRTYTVIGVLKPWRPTPVYFDVINNANGNLQPFYLPFDMIREQDAALRRVGNSDSWGAFQAGDDPDSFFTGAETCWIQYWVELTPDRLDAYKAFIDAYTMNQKELGRFPRPLNNWITPLMEWMEIRQTNPPIIRVLVVISLLFLVVCALNLMGLLLGKFLARAGRVGVYRALGASKLTIFVQYLLECKTVGLAGGLLGLIFSVLALRILNGMMPAQVIPGDLFRLDGTMVAVALLLSLGAGLIAGLYPAWRACNVAPAVQLKLQ